MPSRPKPPPEDEIDEMFVKGTGPGGQKILRHKPTGIVVKSQATRSRTENRAIARSLLAARLDELANGAESRTAVVAAAKQKKKANATKKARRKYRKLEEEAAKAGAVEGEEGAEDERAAVEEGEETNETPAKPEAEKKSMNGSARDSSDVATDDARNVEGDRLPRSKENAGSDQ
ncbi:hypothetical protein SPBR_01025 [Sporothrix brasiliensis 5110]|uniref:Prokaryotic-type class I peptide chain release factors domain-containing protein n=1 Tax=Sporothrix brasiliensis 5110 TaxID=1398154 RepID=A0A0C2J1A0_9PEZI|nr:uncharacterized protein SPBR_01025 [Sporothrix brasiliensis 5110]KIH90897.1 hypothetical protein SPBR_01025 [Sporothrix brasiliensis 5110]